MNFDTFSFFDGTSMVPVTQVTWADYWRGVIPDGVVGGIDNEMRVYANSSGMKVFVDTGACVADNHRGVIESAKELTISTAHTSKPRIDVVVARVVYGNENESHMELAVKKGTAANSPVAPSMTQVTGGTYEVKLAEVYVAPNVVTITAENVTDFRNLFTAGKQAIGFINADNVPLEKGMLVSFSKTVQDAVVRCTVGHIPIGVVQSDYIGVGARGQIETHSGNIGEIMCGSDVVKIGDALIQSDDDPGIARSGSGFAGGLALANKPAGAVGNVRSLLTFFSKLPTQNKWYLLSGMTENDVLCAFQFIGADSETEALTSVNSIRYSLTKSGSVSWNQTKGFYISGFAANTGLVCDSIRIDLQFSAVSAGFGYHYDATPNGEGIGISLFKNNTNQKLLKVVGHEYYGNRMENMQIYNPKNMNDQKPYYYNGSLGTMVSGVMSGDWIAESVYYNGQFLSLTQFSGEELNIFETPILFGVGNGSVSNVNGYITAAVIYSAQLDASQHLELAENIRALGGV